MEIIPSRMRCESKMLNKRLELTYSMNWESFRKRKCLNSSTDWRSDRLLELAGFRSVPRLLFLVFFFFDLLTSGFSTGCSDVLNEGDGGLYYLDFLILRTGSPAKRTPPKPGAFLIFLVIACCSLILICACFLVLDTSTGFCPIRLLLSAPSSMLYESCSEKRFALFSRNIPMWL